MLSRRTSRALRNVLLRGKRHKRSWAIPIKRVFRYRNKQTVLALHRALVRALLEYGAQFWFQIRRVDMERLEKVKARGTKLVPSIRHMGYQRRLADLGLSITLGQSKLRDLLIKTFMILRGFSELDPTSVFELSVKRSQNHVLRWYCPSTTLCSTGISKPLGCATCGIPFPVLGNERSSIDTTPSPVSTWVIPNGSVPCC